MNYKRIMERRNGEEAMKKSRDAWRIYSIGITCCLLLVMYLIRNWKPG